MPRRPRGGVEVQLYSRPRPLYPRLRPGTHCIGGCVGPTDGLDGCGKFRPQWDSTPGPSRRSESLYRLSYPAAIQGKGLSVLSQYFCFPLSVSFHQCSVLICILIPVLSEGQAGEAFRYRGSLERKEFHCFKQPLRTLKRCRSQPQKDPYLLLSISFFRSSTSTVSLAAQSIPSPGAHTHTHTHTHTQRQHK
jgi:hypothetical protein